MVKDNSFRQQTHELQIGVYCRREAIDGLRNTQKAVLETALASRNGR